MDRAEKGNVAQQILMHIKQTKNILIQGVSHFFIKKGVVCYRKKLFLIQEVLTGLACPLRDVYSGGRACGLWPLLTGTAEYQLGGNNLYPMQPSGATLNPIRVCGF